MRLILSWSGHVSACIMLVQRQPSWTSTRCDLTAGGPERVLTGHLRMGCEGCAEPYEIQRVRLIPITCTAGISESDVPPSGVASPNRAHKTARINLSLPPTRRCTDIILTASYVRLYGRSHHTERSVSVYLCCRRREMTLPPSHRIMWTRFMRTSNRGIARSHTAIGMNVHGKT